MKCESVIDILTFTFLISCSLFLIKKAGLSTGFLQLVLVVVLPFIYFFRSSG